MPRALLITTLSILLVMIASRASFAAGRADNDQQPPKKNSLQDEIESLREAIQDLEKRSLDKIRSLEAEIERLRERQASTEAGKPDDELDDEPIEEDLDALLEGLDAEGAGEDDLDSLLGSLTDGPAAGLSGDEPTFSHSSVGAVQSMNPDISAIGNFICHYTTSEGSDFDDEFRFDELELGLSAAIDPFARADFYIALSQDNAGDWEISLEEGYATFLTCPYDIQPRIGKFRSTFGKANSQHLHALPWVEYPLVIENYFGTDGLDGNGAGINWLVPNPWDNYIELTYEITNNDNDTLFGGDESDDFMQITHLKNFFDLTDATTLEAGFSFATAPSDDGHGSNRTNVEGFDLTYKWRPPESGLYRSLLWQTELMAAQADFDGDDESSWGMYSAADYQFARRWTTGVRYDYSEQPFDSALRENAYSVFLTFIQSEFLFWRIAYRYTDRNFHFDGERNGQEVFLQLNFGIGPHRAHKY